MKARQLPPYEELSREDRERLYEHGLPVYLQHDLDAFKDGLKMARRSWTAYGVNCTAASTLRR